MKGPPQLLGSLHRVSGCEPKPWSLEAGTGGRAGGGTGLPPPHWRGAARGSWSLGHTWLRSEFEPNFLDAVRQGKR